MRKCQTLSLKSYTILHFHQKCRTALTSSHHCWYFLSDFDSRHPSRCKMVSHCVLISITLMDNDAEYFFMWLLVICISSLEKCLFKLFVHSLIGLHFSELILATSLLLGINLLDIIRLAKFFPFFGVPTLFIVFFET